MSEKTSGLPHGGGDGGLAVIVASTMIEDLLDDVDDDFFDVVPGCRRSRWSVAAARVFTSARCTCRSRDPTDGRCRLRGGEQMVLFDSAVQRDDGAIVAAVGRERFVLHVRLLLLRLVLNPTVALFFIVFSYLTLLILR